MNPSRILATLFRYTVLYLTGVSLAVFVVLAIGYASVTVSYFRDMNALIGSEHARPRGRISDAEWCAWCNPPSIGERVQASGFPATLLFAGRRRGGKDRRQPVALAGALRRRARNGSGFERTCWKRFQRSGTGTVRFHRLPAPLLPTAHGCWS
jgi:hypothetical protein